jgi:hypothetical protein
MRSALVSLVSLSLVGGLASSSFARGGQDKKPAKNADNKRTTKTTTPAASKQVVLIFPADTALDGTAPMLADMIKDVQVSKLETSGKYSTVRFRRSLPSVRRASTDGTLGSTDVGKPYDASDEKVKRLAQLTGYPVTLVTTINDYQYDAAKNTVSLVMTMKMVDFSKEKPVVKSAGDSYTSPEAAKSKKELDVAQDAVRTLSEKMMADLLAPKTATPSTGEGK